MCTTAGGLLGWPSLSVSFCEPGGGKRAAESFRGPPASFDFLESAFLGPNGEAGRNPFDVADATRSLVTAFFLSRMKRNPLFKRAWGEWNREHACAVSVQISRIHIPMQKRQQKPPTLPQMMAILFIVEPVCAAEPKMSGGGDGGGE